MRSSAEQQLKDQASAAAAIASASLLSAEARASSFQEELERLRTSSMQELSTIRGELLKQQQLTLLAEAAAVDARAAQAVEKLTNERNTLQSQQQLLQQLHDQLQLQHHQQVQLLQVERDKILEQSAEISRLQCELSNARDECAQLVVAQVCHFIAIQELYIAR